jgi:uncharacterized protein (TIGR03492 family)
MKLLCLSNGHGEDAIALRILQILQDHPSHPKLAALPIVGEGTVYQAHNIPIIGPVQAMPSGGFIYMDGRQFARDLWGGLVPLTYAQLKTIRTWSKSGGFILAVGDIVPLLFAWLSGAPYAFVGTAKSEYYLRDEAGLLPRRSWFEQLESWSGSVYLPWERWLMSRRRCRAVFPRDTLTTRILSQWSLPVFDLGNPMLDGLNPAGVYISHPASTNTPDAPQLTLVLLPGSRPPEAYENWQYLVSAIESLQIRLPKRNLLGLGAIAPNLDLDPLYSVLETRGWRQSRETSVPTWEYKNGAIALTQSAFADCLHQADFAIAMAGTATEQFVGLGKPAITIAGNGPQFTPAFAEAQTRLLGPSAILAQSPDHAASLIVSLLQDPDRLQLIATNGRTRMGTPGAAQRIAHCLLNQFEGEKLNNNDLT